MCESSAMHKKRGARLHDIDCSVERSSVADTDSTAEPVSPALTVPDESDLSPTLSHRRRLWSTSTAGLSTLPRCRSRSVTSNESVYGDARPISRSRSLEPRKSDDQSGELPLHLASCSTLKEVMFAFEFRGRVGHRQSHMVFGSSESRIQDSLRTISGIPRPLLHATPEPPFNATQHSSLGKYYREPPVEETRQEARMKMASDYHRYKAWSEAVDKVAASGTTSNSQLEEMRVNASKYHAWKSQFSHIQ